MNKWFIAIKKRGEDIFDLSGLTVIEPPEGHYYADPFLAEEGGKTYVFYEDYDYTKGRLAVGEWDGKELKNQRIILDEFMHVSFPSVVKIDGEWYMTPERCLGGELWIYKAAQFPDVWEPYALVAEGRFDDPILRKVPHGGFQVWTSTDGDKQRIFQSDTLDGPWSLILSEDLPYSRSAGHFIDYMRVAQDSVPIYGRALRFIIIDKVIHKIEPDWYPHLTGTHTFNVSKNYVVIDGRIAL